METEEQNEIKDIIHFLDDFPSLKAKSNNKEIFNFENDKSTIDDYASLVTIKTLKQKPEYYLAKWNVLMKSLINFDDYFYFFGKKKINIQAPEHLSKKNKKKKKNISISGSSSGIILGELSLTKSKDSKISNPPISEDIQSKEMNEFKLQYLKKNIDINFDNIDGKGYEYYVKRTIFAMFILIKLYNFEILNPKDVLYNKLMSISKIEKIENLNDTFEMDMVINGLLLNNIKLLVDKYPKHFFFEDQLNIKDENLNDKVNIVSEISKDLIKDIKNKLIQEKKYINILKAFDKYRTEEILAILNNDNKQILDSFLIDVNNENLFILITNGSYFLLKFAVNIIKSLFRKNNIEEKEIIKIIKDKVDIELNKKDNSLIYKFIQKKKNFCERLYKLYLFFDNLRKNNIRHCLLYIGEESGTEFEDGIISLMNLKKIQTVKDDLNIIFTTKNIIHDLSRIRDDSDAFIKNFWNDIKESLINNSKQIRDIFGSYTLKNNDYIPIKVYVSKENEKNINEIYKYKYFNYEINTFNSNDKLAIYDKIVENTSDIILFVDDDSYLQYKLNKNSKNIYSFPYKNLNTFFKLVLEGMNIEFIKAKCYSSYLLDIDDNIIKKKDILNIDKLFLKIETELGIILDKNKIIDILNVTIDNEKLKKIKSDICKNLEKLSELLEIKNYEKIYNSIDKAYNDNILLLMENIKASVFYDYIYYILLPDIKCEKMKEIFNIK